MNLDGKFQEIEASELKIFEPQMKYSGIIDKQYAERTTSDGSNIVDKNKRIFEIIVSDQENFKQMSEAYLEIRYGVSDINGNALTNTGPVSIVNGASLFETCHLFSDGVQIQTIYEPGMKQLIENLQYTKDAETGLGLEGFYLDRSKEIYKSGGEYRWFNKTQNKFVPVTGTGANPHILTIGGTPADGDRIVVYRDGSLVTFTGPGPVQFTEFIVEDDGTIKSFYNSTGDVEVNFANTNIVSLNQDPLKKFLPFKTRSNTSFIRFTANADLVLTFADGLGTAVILDQFVETTDEYKNRQNMIYNDSLQTYSRSGTVFIPLKKIFSFFDANHTVAPYNVQYRIQLYANKNEKIFWGEHNRTATTYAHINFKRISLWYPILKPSADMEISIKEQIANNQEISISYSDWRHFLYENEISSAGGTPGQVQWILNTESAKPLRVYLYMKASDADITQKQNSCRFQKPYIQTAKIVMNNNIQFPSNDYLVNWNEDSGTGDSVYRLYFEFLRAGGHEFSSRSGPLISLQEFKDLYSVLCFDLRYTDDQNIYKYLTVNMLQLKLTFSQPPQVNSRLYAFVEYERVLTLRSMGNKIGILTQ